MVVCFSKASRLLVAAAKQRRRANPVAVMRLDHLVDKAAVCRPNKPGSQKPLL